MPAATAHWRAALMRAVESLCDMAGMDGAGADDGGQTESTLPRFTRNYLLRLLRPAESAARRLIVLVAREVEVRLRTVAASKRKRSHTRPFSPLEARSAGRAETRGSAQQSPLAATEAVPRPRAHNPLCHVVTSPPQERRKRHSGIVYPSGYRPVCATPEAKPANRTFPLLDPLKHYDFTPRRRYAKTAPRIRALSNISLPVYMRQPEPEPPQSPMPGDPVDAAPVRRRLGALKHALETIDAHAVRLARWQARRDFRRKQPDSKPGRTSPLRIGRPPGYRRRPVHEIDDILRECQALTFIRPPDTG